MGKRWCFLCENPNGCQRSGWLWFHDECARKLMENSGDLIWIMENMKSGKLKSIEDVIAFLKRSKEFSDMKGNDSRYFNALRRNGNKGIRPILP